MTSTPPDPNQPPNQPFGAGHAPYPGAQQPAPGAYGGYPTGPAGAPRQAPPAPPQPSSISLAVKLMWAGAVLSVLSALYSFTTFGDLKDRLETELRSDDLDVTQAQIDAIYGFTIGAVILFGVVGAVLWAWMAWKNGQGRGWARIVATVFAGFNLLGVLFTLGGAADADPLSTVLSIVSVILAAVVVVLLWRKESSAFYEGTAASRRLY